VGIAERREREKEKRRNDIVDAAERVFFSKGWQTATMDDVADEAELSKGTLYLYFKNKEELYAAILVRGTEILHEMFSAAVDGHVTGLEQTAAIGRAYFDFHGKHRDYYEAMMYFDAKGMEACEDCTYAIKSDEYRGSIIELVARAVRNGVEDGTLRPDLDPTKTAVLLWGQSSGVLQVLAIAGEKIESELGIEPGELLEAQFELVYRAIASDPDDTLARNRIKRGKQ
jgi:AcrR family transcriptional regulator